MERRCGNVVHGTDMGGNGGGGRGTGRNRGSGSNLGSGGGGGIYTVYVSITWS